MSYSILVAPEELLFKSVDQELEVTIQNLNDFDVDWKAQVPVKPVKPLKVHPASGMIKAKEQVTIIVAPHPSNPPFRQGDKIKFQFSRKNVEFPTYEMKVPANRSYAKPSSASLVNSEYATEMASSAPLDTNTNVASSNSTAPASPGPANPPVTPAVTSPHPQEIIAQPQPQPSQPSVESEQKDEGFNMVTLIPLAAACIFISMLQTASIREVPLFGSLYSPWTTFMLGIATAYVTYRIIIPSRQLSVAHLKTQ